MEHTGNELLLPFRESGEVRILARVTTGGTVLSGVTLDANIQGVTGFAYDNWNPLYPHLYVVTDEPRIIEVAPWRDLPSERDPHSSLFGTLVMKQTTAFEVADALISDGGDLPPHPLVSTSSLNVTSPAIVADLEVEVEIEHGSYEDLIIELITPTGAVMLLDAHTHLGTGETTRIRYDDPRGGAFDGHGSRPTPGPSRLADADDKPIAGTWTLRITDTSAGGGSGTVHFWSLLVRPRVDPQIVIGEPTNNGSLELIDVQWIYWYAMGMYPAPPCLETMDFDGDGEVEVEDALNLYYLLITPPISAPLCVSADPQDPFDCVNAGVCP